VLGAALKRRNGHPDKGENTIMLTKESKFGKKRNKEKPVNIVNWPRS